MLIVILDIWLMPPSCLHMTTLEITHSLTQPEIEALVDSLKPSIPTVSMLVAFLLLYEKQRSQHKAAYQTNK